MYLYSGKNGGEAGLGFPVALEVQEVPRVRDMIRYYY